MRPIKFRAKDALTGEYRYGDLVRRQGLRAKEIWQIVQNCGYYYVKSETVAQLVGFDKDGREVYEGDIVRSTFESAEAGRGMLTYDYKAHLSGYGTTKDGCWIPAEKFKELELIK
mgnify:CR=1 FL=1